VRGEAPLSALGTEERFVANVELDVALRERATTTSFGQTLLKAGMTAVALDDNGVLTQFHPDGASHPLDSSQPTASQPAPARAPRPG
jgi:hypothetical protein